MSNNNDQPVNEYLAEIVLGTEAVKFGCSMLLVVILGLVLIFWK
jgi:hypothetical protein